MPISKPLFRQLLEAMGFIRGTGFPGEVWTNTDGRFEQVWVHLDGKTDQIGWSRAFDASAEIVDFKGFFDWLLATDAELKAQEESRLALGDRW